MNKYTFTYLLFLFTLKSMAQKSVFIKFEHTANNKIIKLDTTIYTNPQNEAYQLSKLKYYISNISFNNNIAKNVQLIDASKPDSFKINLPKQKIKSIYFQLGVDSILNCTGAQSGALDPLKTMFWTWNSGYINFKLEGFILPEYKTLEHHIGGFKDPFKTMRLVKINIPTDYFKNNKTLIIQMNLDNYWNNNLSLANNGVIATPGNLAKTASENFEKMFSIKK